MLKLVTGLLFGIVIGSSAFAQDVVSTTEAKSKFRPFSISLDGTSVLLSGAGVKATYAVSEKFALGGLIKSYEMKSDSETSSIGYDYKHEVKVLGAIVDFYVKGVNEDGFYISLGATNASVATSVKDTYFGSGSSKDSKSGGQGIIGYQIIPTSAKALNIAFNIGIGYGNAGAVRWSFSGKRTEIENSVLLDLYAGAQF